LVHNRFVDRFVERRGTMSDRDAYRKKMEAELEAMGARLAELRAKAKGRLADARIEYDKQIEQLGQRFDAVKSRLSELASSSDDAWESVKESAESAWSSLASAVKDTAAKFKD
jgi:predicted  nucleic acid-binding Zn-ribbon protein